MKKLLIIPILILGSNLFAQTDSTEKAILYKKMLDKGIVQTEFSRIAMKWNETINEFKKYPDLPFDKSGQVHYSFLNKFMNFNKEKLFNRILEWLTINYGIVPSYIYSNLEDGKIIFRNSLNLNTGSTCNFTTVISIKNEKILMEYFGIAYQTFYEGHYSDDTWIPDKTINVDINQVFPIILRKPTEWKLYLNMLKATSELFNTETKNLYNYILSYDSSYIF